MNPLISILLFILVLSFLIIIHELGHFLVARKCKVKIEEFGLGLPPKVLTLFHWKGIPITLNWLFLGGFVRMEGEDSVEDAESSKLKDQSSNNKEFHPFYERSLWQKVLIVLAGPTVNILFGVIVFSSLYSLYGIPEEIHVPPTVTLIAQNSPAEKAGLKLNDEFVTVSTEKNTDTTEITTTPMLITYLGNHRGQTLKFIIKRDGVEQEIDVYARKTEEIPAGEGTLGVALSDIQYNAKFYPGLEQLYRGTLFGMQKSVEFGKSIFDSLGGIGKSLSHGQIPSDVAGPIGIANEVQKQGLFSEGWATAFNFAALLSINLGIMNLLPIPALDGGRIVLLIIERFVKHKRFEAISQAANQFGFFFLIGLLILITIKDVIGILR